MLLAACGNLSNQVTEDGDKQQVKNQDEINKLKIVTTIFPLYDWTKELLGEQIDRFDLELIYQNGTDYHSYQATVNDIVRIQETDLFLYIGGESDEWIDEVLEQATNKKGVTINAFEIINDSLKEEEHKEGMHEDEESEEEDEIEYDEHIWLSLKNAEIICNEIVKQLSNIDPKYAEYYQEQNERYQMQLEEVDKQYRDVIKSANRNTILVGDRFPFRYLVEDYQLDYYAAFKGCSSDTEASFETVTFLSSKMDELELPVIFILENSKDSLAKTILQNSNRKDAKILVLHSMQTIGKEDIEKEITYLSLMKTNLLSLEQALQ